MTEHCPALAILRGAMGVHDTPPETPVHTEEAVTVTQEPTFPDLPTAPGRSTLERLAQIPILIAEACLTEGAPNPGGERGRRIRPDGSPSLADLDLVILQITNDETPATLIPLPRLVECSRLIWEGLDPDQRQALPLPEGDAPTWPSECDWLIRAWPAAQSSLDRSVIEWIADEVKDLHAYLAAKVRLRRERVYRCPQCADAMRLQPGGQWLLCDSGHEETADLEARYRRLPAMPTPMLSATMGVPEATLRKWRQRRKLATVRVEQHTPWHLPWDVLLLKHPDIAEAVARREAG